MMIGGLALVGGVIFLLYFFAADYDDQLGARSTVVLAVLLVVLAISSFVSVSTVRSRPADASTVERLLSYAIADAQNSGAVRPVQDFGIFPGTTLRVLPVAVGTTEIIPIGDSGFSAYFASERISVDNVPNVQVVFIPAELVVNQDGSVDVHWLDHYDNSGVGIMRLMAH
jgi:hypothetical protein